MRFIYDNLAVIHLAIVVSLTAWIFGGMQSAPLLPVLPWLFLFTLEVVFAFPQKAPGEATYEARERVWRALKKDPFVWVSVALILLLAIPFVNNGLCVGCDRALIALGHDPAPPVKFLPFCVNRMHHLNVFLWFATALSCAVATRHCLRRSGRRLLVEMIVWNGFALAILGFVQSVADAPGPLWQPFTNVATSGTFFSTFGYPNMAGDYFTTLFGLSVALWRRSDDDVHDLFLTNRSEAEKNRYRTFCRRHYHLIPATVFFFAALHTLSRAAIMLVISLSAVYFIHTFLCFSRRMRRAERFRKGTIALAIAALAVFFAVNSLPDDLQAEVDTLDADAVLTRVTGKGQYHVRVAGKIWKDNFLFGCGGWGYKHFCVPKMNELDIKGIQTIGGINVHNDYLQFLAEHGIVGFGLMVAAVLLLLAPVVKVWKVLYRRTRFAKSSDLPAKPVALFVLPAPVFCILTTTLATLIHSFGDCPLRSAAVFVLFYVSLATLPGFLPEESDSPEERHHHHVAR